MDDEASVTSQHRGHRIEFYNGKWRYIENKELVEDNPNISCKFCGKQQTEEGHDGCLGTLMGIKNACCGHGEIKSAYVQFLDGESIHGKDAKIILEVLKRHEILGSGPIDKETFCKLKEESKKKLVRSFFADTENDDIRFEGNIIYIVDEDKKFYFSLTVDKMIEYLNSEENEDEETNF